MTIRDIFFCIFVVFIWGNYFIVEKIALKVFPILLFDALRFLIVFIFTGAYLIKYKIPLKEAVYLAVFNLLNIVLLNYAINLTSSLAPIILIQQLSVPISILLGVMFFKEKFALNIGIGIVVAFVGLIMVVSYHPNELMPFGAAVLAIMNATFFALYNLLAKKLSNYNVLALTSVMGLIGFPILLSLSFFTEDWPEISNITIDSILALLYVSIISTVFCFYLWIKLLNKYPMNKVTPFMLLVPVFGCISTYTMLDEKLTQDIILGGFLIMIGLVMIEWKKKNA